jgi:hypothetical protein
MSGFDASRAKFDGADYFQRFRVSGAGEPLASAGLSPKQDLLVFTVAGVRQVLLSHQMAYHHVAQGEVAGEPYLVSF